MTRGGSQEPDARDERGARRSLPARLLTLLMAAFLPAALAVGAAVTLQSINANRERFEAGLLEAARSAATAVDAKLSSYEAAAAVLAMSPHVRPGQRMGELFEQARLTGEALDGWVVVSQTTPGQPLLLNTMMPPGETPTVSLGQDNAEFSALIDRVKTTGQAAIQNLFPTKFRGHGLVAVATPVRYNGTVQSVVSILFDPASLTGLLERQGLPPGAFASLNDGNLRVIARSPDGETFAGKVIPPRVYTKRNEDSGLFGGQSLDGTENKFAFQNLRLAQGWHVVVGLPIASAQALSVQPLQRIMLAGAAIGSLLLLALGLMWTDRREQRATHDAMDRLLAEVPAAIYVYLVWPDGRIKRQFLSRSATTMTGWARDLLLRAETELTDYLEPEAQTARAAYFAQVLRDGRSQFECRIRFADGSWHWVLSVGSRVERLGDGSCIVVGCVTDVTEERATKDRLHAVEKLAVLGEVATGITHEMNQPLAGLAMAAENGARALAQDPPQIGRALVKFARIETQARRLSGVIDRIRIFGRADEGSGGPWDIREPVNAAVALIQPRLEANGIELEMDLPPGPIRPQIIGTSLEKVLVQILINACDAYRDRPDQTKRLIRIRARNERDNVILSVADIAGGVSESLLSRIFDPFFTTKEVGQGTGLGLSVSLAMITEAGGNISARNEDGGTCFEITLPAAKQDAA